MNPASATAEAHEMSHHRAPLQPIQAGGYAHAASMMRGEDPAGSKQASALDGEVRAAFNPATHALPASVCGTCRMARVFFSYPCCADPGSPFAYRYIGLLPRLSLIRSTPAWFNRMAFLCYPHSHQRPSCLLYPTAQRWRPSVHAPAWGHGHRFTMGSSSQAAASLEQAPPGSNGPPPGGKGPPRDPSGLPPHPQRQRPRTLPRSTATCGGSREMT